MLLDAAIRNAAARQDEGAIAQDLAAYFGEDGRSYLASAARALNGVKHGRKMILYWSWPAFWCWYVWLLYRKCPAEAAIAIIAVMLGAAADAAWPATGGMVSALAYLAVCLWAKPAYLRRAFSAIARADAAELDGEARRRALARAGGTSWASAAAGLGLLVAAIVAWTAWRLPDILAQADAWGLLPPQ